MKAPLAMAVGILITCLAMFFVLLSPLAQARPMVGAFAAMLVVLAGAWVTTRAVLYNRRNS